MSASEEEPLKIVLKLFLSYKKALEHKNPEKLMEGEIEFLNTQYGTYRHRLYKEQLSHLPETLHGFYKELIKAKKESD